jgi:long-subunit fatty acid transport protein
MMHYDDNLDEYYSEIGDADYKQFQRKSIDKNGSVDEYSIASGINFNHKFYLGVSMGLIDVYYRESTRIFEEDINNNIPNFKNFAHNSFLQTHGFGHNFKFGAIYKPVNEIRLGVSVHTPTYYKLHDLFETSMESYIDWDVNPDNYFESSPESNYDYKLRTPLKATFSGAFIIAKKGLLSIDYEYVDYTNAELHTGGDGYDFTDENIEIDQAYKTSGNLRVGGEYRVSNTLSLRGGYELHGSAFNSQAFGSVQPNSASDLTVYSGGLGYKSGLFSFDVAYRYSERDYYDLPYQVPVSEYYPAPQMASIKNNKHNLLYTIGYKF